MKRDDKGVQKLIFTLGWVFRILCVGATVDLANLSAVAELTRIERT